MDVTVVIPAWNEENCIEDTIDALKAQTHPIRIIVLDDASTDSTPKLAKNKGVEVFTAPKQGSKSKALNYAIPYVETDIFVCVDADTVLAPNAIEEIIKAFDHDKVMVASGMVHSKNHENFWQSSRSTEYVSMQKIVKSAQEKWKMVLVASGCFFAIKTDYLKKRGGFPDRTLAEDMDLTWMAVEDGYEIEYIESAKCWVDDPYNFYTYKHQVERWFRGLFQNIRVRNFNLFNKRFKLGMVVYGYFLLNLVSIPMIFYAAITGFLQMLTILAIGFSIVFVYYYIYGEEGFFKSIRSTLNFIACSFLNQYPFIKSGWLELVS